MKQQTGAATTEITNLSIKVLKRRAWTAYLPAFLFEYHFSETHNHCGEIVPAEFQVMLSGLASGGVSGERHFCPKKAQVATTGVAGALGAAAMFLGDPTWLGQTMVEATFWTFMAASTAGRSTVAGQIGWELVWH